MPELHAIHRSPQWLIRADISGGHIQFASMTEPKSVTYPAGSAEAYWGWRSINNITASLPTDRQDAALDRLCASYADRMRTEPEET
jgi:hypothetical protein